MKNGKDELDLSIESMDAEIARLEKKKKLQAKKKQLDKLKAETGELPIMKKLWNMRKARI